MATISDPFYGCICLETSSDSSIPLIEIDPALSLPEIHFNIWEEGTDAKPFLDIGVMLPLSYPAEFIEIFLPWKVQAEEIEDLSRRILGPNGVSAIFNEDWTSSSSMNSPGGYVTRTNNSVFAIVPYSTPVITERILAPNIVYSIVLKTAQLRATSLATCKSAQHLPDQMYVRIRVKNVPKKFYLVGFDQGDAFGGGAFNRTEIIDFRMNVRRGVPAAFESRLNGRFIKFSKVQLFLMKSRDQDIVFEDKLFQACRSLEDEQFWAGYILPVGASATAVDKCLKQVKESLGYQWKKSLNTNQREVLEFGMLARFKSFKIKFWTVLGFISLAVALGVAGNGVYDLLKWFCIPQAIEVSQANTLTQLPEIAKPGSDEKLTNQNSGKETLK